jgi:hypothetical protein
MKYLQVKLVNISSNDIVDGNPKLTLGLVWSIILHWQVNFEYFNLKFLFLKYVLKFVGSHEFENINVGAAANKFGEDSPGVVPPTHQTLQLGRPKLHNQLVRWFGVLRNSS